MVPQGEAVDGGDGGLGQVLQLQEDPVAVSAEGLALHFVTLEKKGPVGIVTMNRPEALNALDKQVLEDLNTVLDQVESDRKQRNIFRNIFLTER